MTVTMTDIPMPQMGESITEATIVQWYRKVGDEIAADETLLEISTAKVEAEIPAPCDGVIAEILFEEGETVDVDTIIARIAPPGTAVDASAANGKPAKKAKEPEGSAAAATAEPEEDVVDAASLERERRHLLLRKSTPLVRSMVRELGLDLEQIPGTGRHGRVTKGDVLKFLESRDSGKHHEDYPVHGPGASETLGGLPLTFGKGLPDLVEPMSAMRKSIARHMVDSRRISPHAHTVHEVDFTKTMALREKAKERFQETLGVKLTPLSLILKAVTEAIVKYPIFNSSVIGTDSIAYHRSINIGVAVALERGLIVPVIRNMEHKSVGGIAESLHDIATRARTKKLVPADVEGGTLTVTSPGQKGALMGLPILAQPQVAVLYVGSIKKRPCVIEGADGTDVIGIRSMGILTLALDHRVIDGWVADSFMMEIRERLEAANFDVDV